MIVSPCHIHALTFPWTFAWMFHKHRWAVWYIWGSLSRDSLTPPVARTEMKADLLHCNGWHCNVQRKMWNCVNHHTIVYWFDKICLEHHTWTHGFTCFWQSLYASVLDFIPLSMLHFAKRPRTWFLAKTRLILIDIYIYKYIYMHVCTLLGIDCNQRRKKQTHVCKIILCILLYRM